jgi:DNA-binding LacI/PurR family transcriptional regulator/DNA-binding transcriptional regulator YhcF (GntR family)
VADLDDLSRRVLLACAQERKDPLAMFPSERDLAKALGVSRYSVRCAIDHLEQRGAVQRVPGRGVIALARPHAATPAQAEPVTAPRCINFLISPAQRQSPLQWLMYEYIAGYNQVLDLLDLKTRFVVWDDHERDFGSAFWPAAAREEQACVLINRRGPDLLNWLNEQRVPYVLQSYAAYDDSALPPHHSVCVNKMGGAFDGTRHLLELGHQRVGFVGPLPHPQALTPEHEGWLAAVRWAGYSPGKGDALDLSTEDVDAATGPCRAFLDRPDRPTAVLAANGAALAGLSVAAQTLGIQIPRDLSLIGFTSPVTTSFGHLSIIEVPRRDLGRTAVELVLKLARDASTLATPARIVLNCKLELRGTTAPPPRA